MPSPGLPPEQLARQTIDANLRAAGWLVQDRADLDLRAGLGVAVREYEMAPGHGIADYLLFVEGRAVGVLEAKKAGEPLRAHEWQASDYARGLPATVAAPVRPLPFVYLSNGVETLFANGLDPHPVSREVFAVHQPETLAEWLAAESLQQWVQRTGAHTTAEATRPSTLRSRLRAMPDLATKGLYPVQVRAIANLERSLRENRPRALVQMATGSGKTFTAVSSIYRLVKFGGARRVLFLVDRSNLGKQAFDNEFSAYVTPDDNRRFPELYVTQHLQSNVIGASTKVVITTIQRLYSMLQGRADFTESEEATSLLDDDDGREPAEVRYSRAIPPEYFDVIFVDECHRSIYSKWRQVLEYFDAFLIGLTATPASHTYAFFDQNVVIEYGHDDAVADGVNVGFDVYRIRTKITEQGASIAASGEPVLGLRDRRTRQLRWQAPDQPITYTASDLDRAVVARDQLRTVIHTLREKLSTEIFPGRKEVPKTLFFCKDDSHAEDVTAAIRAEFGRGNDFCRKITYKVDGERAEDLIAGFRNDFMPRMAVTVDMIATGTDIKPVEVVVFLRMVKSRLLFEQMKGRGVRICPATTMQHIAGEPVHKTHFVVVDCVGVTEQDWLAESQPLEQQPGVPLRTLLERIRGGHTDDASLSSLVSRLTRLDRRCSAAQQDRLLRASGGLTLASISHGLVHALDADAQEATARQRFQLDPATPPDAAQLAAAKAALVAAAVKPLLDNPTLCDVLVTVRQECDQVIDPVSRDELLEAGFSPEAKQKAQALVQRFEQFVADKKDEIAALQFFYSVPHRRRLRYDDIKALAAALGEAPVGCSQEQLWRAYEILARDRVRGASARRMLVDVVSLVRYALKQDDELVPFAETVQARFASWLAKQGGRFTSEQVKWLEMIREQVATSVEITIDDFDGVPFLQEGGLGRAQLVFGGKLAEVLREVNEVLAA